MNIAEFNRKAWDGYVESGNRWTIPVSSEDVKKARQGNWKIVLTPTKPIPQSWYPALAGCDLLCLASGGGQQGPILAAAGATVTVFDNSPKQLGRDRMVAERDSLNIRTVQGDMADLSVFADESFDLIIHPVSNTFVPDVKPVWKEAYRVLRKGGAMLSGFTNPINYIFDDEEYDKGNLVVRHKLPYSDQISLSPEEQKRQREKGYAMEFSHTFDDQIGGQIDAGFLIAGFYEDVAPGELLEEIMPSFFATRAIK